MRSPGAARQGHGRVGTKIFPEGREDTRPDLVRDSRQVDHMLLVRWPRDGVPDLAVDQAHGENGHVPPAAQGVLERQGDSDVSLHLLLCRMQLREAMTSDALHGLGCLFRHVFRGTLPVKLLQHFLVVGFGRRKL